MSTNRTGRTAIGVAASVALVLAGCGGSDSGGDIEAFCDQIRALDAAGEAAGEDLATAAEQFDALTDDAPDDIEDDLRIVVDAFGELDEIDEDDPASFELFFEIFERPDFVAAIETLEQFGVDECGLEPATDASAPDDVIGGDIESGVIGSETSDDVDDGAVKTASVPGDPYDEDFWGPIDADEVSIPGLEQHLDVNYPDEGWFGGSLNGSSLSGSEVTVFADLEGDDAVRLCDAVLEYAGGIDADSSVSVEANEQSTLLASGNMADGCVVADGLG
jgi:hypothetical protein